MAVIPDFKKTAMIDFVIKQHIIPERQRSTPTA
jgi:hypothetical protein